MLPIAGGLTVLHTPGHCAGQICLLWPPHGGVLLAADAAANTFGLGLSVTYEDRAEGERQLHRLAALDFRVACFGHGKAIIGDAASRFRRRWPVGSAPDAEPGDPVVAGREGRGSRQQQQQPRHGGSDR